MHFTVPESESYIPDGAALAEACARTTHLAVGAHQDDLEIMAYDGIIRCFQRADRWFSAVVVTNGGGAPRTGLYADLTDEEMMAVRRKEQKKAAMVGDYSVQFLLNHPSAAVKDPDDPAVVNDLRTILEATRPEVVYTHNPADKHDTHVGVMVKLIEAIRSLPAAARPGKVYGCEVWRDLDWMCDADKVVFDVSAHENLQAALLGVFDSQVSGGKRYDLATIGRRRAHATYHASHDVDAATSINFAMDLTPLVQDDTLTVHELVRRYMRRFSEEIEARIGKMGG
ncbi:MAG TPA: PIG-L family deacetylase [Candidatus Hydrogenedentes bacterium]|nr:MAG: GlcNAc-PI de-N-acetylase [Candidatus Hydrogenedentes bacterium ADurb.Bin179]HOH29036.1 PIG-L family deacetylase [Candidatus Hydrogenedentota bacterium]